MAVVLGVVFAHRAARVAALAGGRQGRRCPAPSSPRRGGGGLPRAGRPVCPSGWRATSVRWEAAEELGRRPSSTSATSRRADAARRSRSRRLGHADFLDRADDRRQGDRHARRGGPAVGAVERRTGAASCWADGPLGRDRLRVGDSGRSSPALAASLHADRRPHARLTASPIVHLTARAVEPGAGRCGRAPRRAPTGAATPRVSARRPRARRRRSRARRAPARRSAASLMRDSVSDSVWRVSRPWATRTSRRPPSATAVGIAHDRAVWRR